MVLVSVSNEEKLNKRYFRGTVFFENFPVSVDVLKFPRYPVVFLNIHGESMAGTCDG